MSRPRGALSAETPELVARVQRLRAQGLYFHEIAQMVQRSKTRVQQICLRYPPPIDPGKAAIITAKKRDYWRRLDRRSA